jgi:3'-phosphoadenosine 5'-phosphosulfate sulfotransferase (PAPS reductase)/FAD synthetase
MVKTQNTTGAGSVAEVGSRSNLSGFNSRRLQLPAEIQELVAQGALFAVNHSGGKDSQAQLIKLLEVIPAGQIVVVHADLGEVEWKGARELAEKQAADAGVPFIVARPVTSFLQMVERRFATKPGVPSWPSAEYRQCTSDLKRGPIDRELRRYAKAHGFTTIVSCVGIRALESDARSKLEAFKINKRNTIAGRQWFDWLPIFDLTTADVFATIATAGQEPHWAYGAGNERLSCVFCIMGSRRDLANGAKQRPELLAKYVELEQRTGYTMHMSRKPLLELIAEAEHLVDAPHLECMAAA